MPKNDQEDAFEKVLVASLARVIDLVKFAETKNAALLAYSSAWTVAIANLMSKGDQPSPVIAPALPVAAALFVISALIALYSILPKVDLSSFFHHEQRASRQPNLLFFGDISGVKIADFPQKLRDSYFALDERSITDDYVNDLSCQIHVNSTIASRKYALFKRGAWVALSAMAILVIPPLWGMLKMIVMCLAASSGG